MKKEERIAKETIAALEQARQKWNEKPSLYRSYGIEERDLAEKEIAEAFRKMYLEVDIIAASLDYAHFLAYNDSSVVYEVIAYREPRSVTITKMRVVEKTYIHVEN